MSSAPFCKRFRSSLEAQAILLAFAKTFEFKSEAGWGFWGCHGNEHGASGQYYYLSTKRLPHFVEAVSPPPSFAPEAPAVEYVRRVDELRDTTEFVTWQIDRHSQTLEVSGCKRGFDALIDQFRAIERFSFRLETWRLNLPALVDALPAVLGDFDLFGGTLPTYMAGDGMQGGGKVSFLHVEKAAELFHRHAEHWLAIELRGKWGEARRLRISAKGRVSFHEYPRDQAPAPIWRHRIQGLFAAVHELPYVNPQDPAEVRRRELAEREARALARRQSPQTAAALF